MANKIKLPPLPSLRPLLPTNLTVKSNAKIKEVDTNKAAGIPFFHDPLHKAPTRSLYRSLIRSTRSSPGHNLDTEDRIHQVDWVALRRNVREQWKKRKGLTSIPHVESFLAIQQDLARRLISTTTEIMTLSHTLAKRQAAADVRAIPQPTRKPYLAGYLRPTHFNPPLPRLKPQPIPITLMIKKRIAARARRLELQRANTEMWNDIHSEMGFMRRLHEREGLEVMKGFRADLEVVRGEVQRGYERDEERKKGVFGIGVVGRVEKARRARQEWKRLKAGERGVTAKSEEARPTQV